jgi:hypothetical protein
MAPVPPLPRPAHRHKKKAAKLPARVLKEKATNVNANGPSLGELPVVDLLRNFLTAPSEEILGTLTAMQDMVSRQSGAYG